jgi:hypothetical protein
LIIHPSGGVEKVIFCKDEGISFGVQLPRFGNVDFSHPTLPTEEGLVVGVYVGYVGYVGNQLCEARRTHIYAAIPPP